MRIFSFFRASVLCSSVLCVFLLCGLCDSVVRLTSLAGEADGSGFVFPEDAAGRLLAKELSPKDAEKMRPERMKTPRRSFASDSLKPPALPLPPSHAALPRRTEEHKRSPLRPHLIEEERLGAPFDALPLPQRPALPDHGRIRVASADVDQSIPLPILAQPVSDRAALDDPTADASAAAARAAPIPPRTRKAPFVKRTLPDPYDHRRTDVPAPGESMDFPIGNPQTPRR